MRLPRGSSDVPNRRIGIFLVFPVTYFRTAQRSPLVTFCALVPNEKPYHAWAGYSFCNSTCDFQYHAVDWCWQSPDEYLSGIYHWFTLRDVSDPHHFYRSISYWCKGTKKLTDPPPLTYPAHAAHV